MVMAALGAVGLTTEQREAIVDHLRQLWVGRLVTNQRAMDEFSRFAGVKGWPFPAGVRGPPPLPPATSDTIFLSNAAPRYPGLAKTSVDLTIGEAAATAEYQFTSIAEISIGHDGTVFVVDRPTPQRLRLQQSRLRSHREHLH